MIKYSFFRGKSRAHIEPGNEVFRSLNDVLFLLVLKNEGLAFGRRAVVALAARAFDVRAELLVSVQAPLAGMTSSFLFFPSSFFFLSCPFFLPWQG